MIRIVLPHLNQSGWVSDGGRPFIWAARRSWSTLSFFSQQARIMSAAGAVQLFIGCLPLWCWLVFALGGCCGLHLGPLATVVLVLSPVSFSMMFFKYCFVEFWLCLPLYYFSLVAERKSWIDLRRAFILVVYAFLVYFFNQVARAVNLCFAVSTALVMPSCCTSYLSGTYL